MSEQLENQVKGMSAQVRVQRQIIGEQADQICAFRTNLQLFQDSHSEISNSLKKAEVKIAELEAKLKAFESPAHPDAA